MINILIERWYTWYISQRSIDRLVLVANLEWGAEEMMGAPVMAAGLPMCPSPLCIIVLVDGLSEVWGNLHHWPK